MRHLLKISVPLVLTALLACPGPTELPQGTPLLLMVALPQSIDDQGAATTVRVEARLAQDTPGTGEVELSTLAGQFENEQKRITLRLEDGQASTSYRCVREQDTACRRIIVLSGKWNDVTGMTTVLVRGDSTSDGGTELGQLLHVSTLCDGQPCTLLGVRGSGYRERAQLTFRLQDAQGQPIEGEMVAFSLVDAPTGTMVTPSGMSNAQGEVIAAVTTGPQTGTFVVRAVADTGEEASSAPLAVRGARATNDGFSLRCDQLNLAAYASDTPPAPLSVPCTVRVVDRHGNPVGNGPEVYFQVEAGSITSSTFLTHYAPTGDNAGEGTGSVTFSTLGGPSSPVDVEPLPALEAQLPRPRQEEPREDAGSLRRNPRDGLVTVLAYMSGEEAFTDANGNGGWDVGEQFTDQGEPFVDANDDGVWNEGEDYIDANGNGVWDGPNGIRDGHTLVWTETHLLYTGRPVVEHSFLMGYDFATVPPSSRPFSGDCGSGVGKGEQRYARVYCADAFFNRPPAQDTLLLPSHTATKGSVSLLGGSLQDGLGFGLERRKRDATSPHQDCAPGTSRCIWRTLFFDWGYGHVGDVVVQGAPATDTTACQPDSLRVTCEVLGVGLTVSTPGAIE